MTEEIDYIREREARQDRAFRSRRNPALKIRCRECRDQIGEVFNSDEGLVLVLLSSFAPPGRWRKAKLAALKLAGRRSLAKAMEGSSEFVIELLSDRTDGRLLRHRCSRHVRPIDWRHIEARIDANEPDARI